MTSFSLIIPYHNTEANDRTALIHDLLKTIPDRADLEIILVNDNSLTAYQPIRVFDNCRFSHINNKSGRRFAGTARNTGLEIAQGKYVFFADSDDLFNTDALERSLDAVLNSDGEDLIIARCTSFKDDKTDGDRHKYMETILREFKETGNSGALIRLHSPVSKFVRRDFIRENGITFGDTRVANDVLFNVRLISTKPRVKIIDETVYHIRQGNVSLTNDPGVGAARTRIKVARQAQRILKDAGQSDIRQPMIYAFMRFAKAHPIMVGAEIIFSIIHGDLIVANKRRALRQIVGRIRSA